MNILFVASEAVPFCKTGGLADVVGALSKVLHQRGHDVRLVLPRYQSIDGKRFRPLPLLPEIKVQYRDWTYNGSVSRCIYPGTQMPVYLIDEPDLFGRKELYGNGKTDFADNDRRFAFFNMATLWLLKGLDWRPDVIHAHDWQTGLLPALLRHHPIVAADPLFTGVHTVFSIHNLAYQGNFDKFLVPNIGLPWTVFDHDGLEFYGRASFLKSGLVYSDELVAVSPTYSREIQSDEQGAGMAGTLRLRANNLHGILNGIDADLWNPAADTQIAATYHVQKPAGKASCKQALQEFAGFSRSSKTPVIGMISRLVSAKGFDLVTRALDDLLQLPAQYIILGSGDPGYEEALVTAAQTSPDRLFVRIGYDEVLAHQIIAGSDIFLMPSSYEPCGLTQLYAMRYGTVPVVRRTGGLADSVVQANEDSIRSGGGTGFLFDDYLPSAMLSAVRRALDLYAGQPRSWQRLMSNAMSQDFSWNRSAQEYERLYQQLGKLRPEAGLI